MSRLKKKKSSVKPKAKKPSSAGKRKAKKVALKKSAQKGGAKKKASLKKIQPKKSAAPAKAAAGKPPLNSKPPSANAESATTTKVLKFPARENVKPAPALEEAAPSPKPVMAALNEITRVEIPRAPRRKIISANGVQDISPVQGAMDTEVRLTGALTKLLACPHFEENKERKLGEFWQTDWPRAPFEECLTLLQISQFKPAVLLKKRSFSPAKAAALIGAIEKFVSTAAGGLATPQKEGTPNTPPLPVSPAPTLKIVVPDAAPAPLPEEVPPEKPRELSVDGITFTPWPLSEEYLPSHALSFLKYFELQCRLVKAPSQMSKLLCMFPQVLTPCEFIFLWFYVDYGESTIASFLKQPEERIFELKKSAQEKLLSALEKVAPQALAHWKASLAGAGIRKEELLKPYFDPALDMDFQRSILILTLRILGATKPQAFGYTFKEYLTSEQKAVEAVLTLVLKDLPKDDNALREELRLALPLYRVEDLLEAIKRQARFHLQKRIWEH